MNWLPSFLNIWTAAAAAAVVVPSLLLLYFLKLRRREMPISSTLLWRKAIQDLQVNSPFQRLRRNLLLLLQLLLLALLLLALARPIANYTPGAGKMTVILIDRSASMSANDGDASGKTRLDEAKRRARKLVETLERNASAMIVAFDDSAEIILPFSGDIPALKAAIDRIQPTDRMSRLKLAYQLAEAQATVTNPDQDRTHRVLDVWVFSDGRVLDAADLSIKAVVHYDRIGSENTGNIALVTMSGKRNYERPTEVQVFARLANYGTDLAKSDVQLSVDGRVRTVAGTTLHPLRWTEQERRGAEQAGDPARDSVEFTIDLPEAAVIRIEQMNKEGDALLADDVAQVVVPPPRPLSVLLVSDGTNLFLERAIDSLRLNDPKRMVPAEYEQQVPGQFDVIIFDRYSPKALPPAGNFMYFGGVGPGLKVKPREGAEASASTAVGVLDWKRDHPLLKGLQMEKLYIVKAMRLDVPRDSEVIVDGTQGPLMVLHREGPGLHLFVGFDLLESNWPLKPSFPLFMSYAMQYLAVGSDMNVRQSYQPGATPTIPRANLQRVDAAETLTVSGPDGRRVVTVPPAGDVALPALDHVGIYSLEPPVPQFEQFAVNLLDENESNLVPAEAPPGGIGAVVQGSAGQSRLELWWWIIACLALPLLIIEWWVYTRRVHL